MTTLLEATRSGTRAEQLHVLAYQLATAIDDCIDAKTLPQLSRQYRETMREIEEIEGGDDTVDEISEIINRSNRKPRTDGKGRSNS